MTLTIDQGNSAAKLAVWEGERLLSQSLCHPLTEGDIAAVLSLHDISAAIYCSVSQSGSEPVRWLRERGVKAMELTCDTPLPIAIGYSTPHTLGRDRIAAAVGAWSRYEGSVCLVIDVGTAITYDVVDTDGRFVGGNIAPGPWMRLQSLHDYTARLPEVSAEEPVEQWGTDTPGAMRAGAIIGIVGEIAYYRSALPAHAKCVITGGDSRLILPFLDSTVVNAPNLVGEGLNRILQYNEDR